MRHTFPSAQTRNPLTLPDGQIHEGTVFLSAAISHPRWDIGAYSYASAFDPPDDWAMHLAPYLYPESAERLAIGRFCQIADSVLFITTSANHRYDGISTYPFAVFDGFGEGRPSLPPPESFRDTVIGNDVWLGQGVRVLPGAHIGDGCMVGAGAVVGGVVPPYSVVVGNPARVVRRRFDPETVIRLQEIAWWDWPIDDILAHEAEICGGEIRALQEASLAR